ncbi:TerD family protein [Nocardioides sp. C4-1]|uniref:TerD family protein n=1 Tax=Nocardioides sp. C4-1 TaxID=3151851 RepID=UPI00326517F4
MTELRSGENRPWPEARATVYVAGARVAALLLGADGRAVDATPWADAARPSVRGVVHLPGEVEGVTADLTAVDAGVARVVVVATGFAGPPTAQLLTSDGAVAFTVTPAGLSSETALVMVEVYRRDGAWKVRALAQGYAGGLGALAAAYGTTAPAVPTPPPPPSSPTAPAAAPAAAPPTVDDPVRHIGMILDDASRTTASFESSAAYAQRRLEADLEHLVGDPSLRMGPAADAARAEAQQRHDELVGQAAERHRADLAQLTDELRRLDQVLPGSLASWGAPAWTRPPLHEAPWAFRLGEIALRSAPDFRLPMVRHVPLAPPVWIETDTGGEVTAARMMAAITTRMMVALPRAPRVSVVDVGDRARLGHLPASTPPATDAAEAARLLDEHLEHLRILSMARQSGAVDDLPPEHRPGRLLLLPDFPGALDESSVNAVHQLVTHGAELGVSVVISGRRPESLGIAVLDFLHEACLRIPSEPGGDLVDAYGGVGWIFHPDLGPDDPRTAQVVNEAVTRRVADRDRP